MHNLIAGFWFNFDYRQIGEKTILIGLSTTRFRDAPHSSHEVHIDDEQLEWFVETVEAHPASDGWKILVFSHAPIMGSGLRVLQNVHVMNGCAWLNHCSQNRNRFIRTVKANPQIKVRMLPLRAGTCGLESKQTWSPSL